ncbi:hypothetical protein FRX31_005835 [Thalictrum thalictroides]|uniref:Uncharacterized protein n=1 Tax=Thalictrum thalictroides TaxID=46969 RepID=A0A7J6X688_THATH|nr:hypothetical protein FRX31_005835 [Thalictrum thalictroides]
MSKSSSNAASFQAAETVPQRVISMDRRPSFIKKLETIQEEGDTYNRNGKPARLDGATNEFAKRRPSILAK